METIRKSIPLLLAFVLLGSGGANGEGRQSGVAGRVLGAAAPIASAGVYAYELADLRLHKVKTDAQGNFRFSELPAGLYKVIAHKSGFMPVVVMLTRTTAQAYQFLELELAARAPSKASGPAPDDFWALRAHVPADVLRSIQADEALRLASFEPVPGGNSLANFHTRMSAMTGVAQSGTAGEGQVADGRLGIEGRVGPVQVDLSGRFWQFSPGGTLAPEGAGGQARALSLSLAAGGSSRIHLTSLNNRLVNPNDGDGTPVDLEHYQVSWTQDVGQNGRSDFAAVYTTESNYHRLGWFDPVDIPEASTTWRVEGAYTMNLGDRSTLQTGLRYRERQFGLGAAGGRGNVAPGQSSVDLFSRGGLQVRPAVLVEYGLYSTLSDGSLSLTPQGGIVLQLGQHWQAAASASRRVYQDALRHPDFLPALYEEGDLCEQGSEACYQVRLTRKLGDENEVSLSALHRTVGETLRLYFSDQLMDRLESLYLVRGDELPELQFTLTRRLSPQVLTTLQSSVASGGGGTFVSGSQQPYENRVRYMVTSLDTRFQSTSTGVFIAFHQLQQNLEPVGSQLPKASLAHERLRLMLSQDLNILLDHLAADWAVQLNMELSRGPEQSAIQGSDDLQRRFMGGIAVKF